MRSWLLTKTAYGSGLPGDRRGSVTCVLDRRPGDADTISHIEVGAGAGRSTAK